MNKIIIVIITTYTQPPTTCESEVITFPFLSNHIFFYLFYMQCVERKHIYIHVLNNHYYCYEVFVDGINNEWREQNLTRFP